MQELISLPHGPFSLFDVPHSTELQPDPMPFGILLTQTRPAMQLVEQLHSVKDATYLDPVSMDLMIDPVRQHPQQTSRHLLPPLRPCVTVPALPQLRKGTRL